MITLIKWGIKWWLMNLKNPYEEKSFQTIKRKKN